MATTEKKVALILSDNFDADEFSALHRCLINAGILVSVVSEKENTTLHSWDKNTEVLSEVSYDEARSYGYDAAIISGRFSPDEIRTVDSALALVRDIFQEGKLVCAIDHGAQVLISAGFLGGKNIAGRHSIKVDLENAGAHYLNDPIVVDNNLVTGRSRNEINEFCEIIVKKIFGYREEKGEGKEAA
jgi:protease I